MLQPGFNGSSRSFIHSLVQALLLALIPWSASQALALEQSPSVELFVSAEHGNDEDSGASPQTALSSVQAAIDRAGPGSTITLLPGRHRGGVVMKPGEPGRPIVLRAQLPGRTFLSQSVMITGFTALAGTINTAVAPLAPTPAVVLDPVRRDVLRNMPSVEDVEFLAGTYFHDAAGQRLYIHPHDSGNPTRAAVLIALPGIGVTLADHTVVDGLVLSGWGQAAIQGNDATAAIVRGCTLFGNGFAVMLRGGRDCQILANHCWLNVPAYGDGSQIHITAPRALNITVADNIVHSSSQFGVRFYSSGPTENCLMRGNLVYDNDLGGIYFKGGVGPHQAGERNISFNRNDDFRAAEGGFNTYVTGAAGAPPHDTDLIVRGPDRWRFADRAYHDYRLQSDSPARKAGPGGVDLGALPFDASVVFVSPQGDDAADGLSQGNSWRTLRHAAAAVKPGQTLYLAPGEWNEPLTIRGLISEASKPARLRVQGKGIANVPALLIEGCQHLVIEDIRVRGAESRVAVSDSQHVTLSRVVSQHTGAAAAQPGVQITRSGHVTVEHSAVASPHRSAIGVEDSSDVQIVSNLLAHAGGPPVERRGQTPGFWSEFNGLLIGSDALAQWRADTGGDRESLAIDEADLVSLSQGDFRVRQGRPAAFAARYCRTLGPHGVLPDIARPAIERVEVLSTTRTTANITYWTPGRITGTAIQWGTSTDYGAMIDRSDSGRGERETFHTISLAGLQPRTTYHFRVGFRDHDADPEERVNRQGPLRWSDDFTFTTLEQDPQPRQLHVSTLGDDAHDGLTPATAWRTLHQAARHARAGDTVTLAPGRYLELLRPLQTGSGPDRRITFRAQQPLTVFLDGGFVRAVGDSGRSHAVQIMNKAYITLENLVCQNIRLYDNGGYRGGFGYGGIIQISGSAGIEVTACVMDGRLRYMTGLVALDAGLMPGLPDDLTPLVVTDCLFLRNWMALHLVSDRTCLFRHNAFIRAQVKVIAGNGPDRSLVLRNNIITCLIPRKERNSLIVRGAQVDADYNCYLWDPENTIRVIAWVERQSREGKPGLAGWQQDFQQDPHSLEANPGSALTQMTGATSQAPPFTVEDVILPPNSPCRGAGENGQDIGPRWERFRTTQPAQP
jgi:nitrous oxidase accessory protein NosD